MSSLQKLFFRLSNPNSFSVLSLQRISSPLKLFTDILWNLIDLHFSCAEDSRSGQSTPGGVTQEQIERKNHLPQPAGHSSFDTAEDMAGILGCEHMVLTHA